MFDEYFNPPSIAVSLVQEAVAPRVVVLADSPVSTSIDQDAPSTSIPSTQEQENSPNISQGFEESPKHQNFRDDPLHEDSTSQGSSSNVRQTHTLFEHLGRWTKDHPIANVIEKSKLDEDLQGKPVDATLYRGMIGPSFVLDALALTPCYSAFLITTDVLEVYMHQFWDSIYKHDTFYRFKMDKRKRFKLTLEIFRDIFKICPRVQGQDFDALPTDEEIVSFLRDLGHTREIHSLNDVSTNPLRLLQLEECDYVELLWKISFTHIDNKTYKKAREHVLPSIPPKFVLLSKKQLKSYGAILPESLTSPEMKETKAYKTYLGFATGATPPKKARKFKKPASPQLTTVLVSSEEPTRKSKRVKRPAKKYTKALARGVVIRETPEMPLSKKKDVTP
ncbi:hypothetical protein Tco_1256059 [Tanacetum coccineum]